MKKVRLTKLDQETEARLSSASLEERAAYRLLRWALLKKEEDFIDHVDELIDCYSDPRSETGPHIHVAHFETFDRIAMINAVEALIDPNHPINVKNENHVPDILIHVDMRNLSSLAATDTLFLRGLKRLDLRLHSNVSQFIHGGNFSSDGFAGRFGRIPSALSFALKALSTASNFFALVVLLHSLAEIRRNRGLRTYFSSGAHSYSIAENFSLWART
jgi:hypothetical protein